MSRLATGLCGLLAAVAIAAIGAASADAAPELRGFEISRTTAQAGGHPDVFANVSFSTKDLEVQESQQDPTKTFDPCFCTDPKTFTIHFPTGFIGNPHAIPTCTLAQLGLYRCPPDSQVGLASALFGTQFLYNMEPRPGEPGLLASQIPLLGTPVFTILRARTDSDYGLDATTPNIFHLLGLQQVSIRIWGVPTDPANDPYRSPTGFLFQRGCFRAYPEPCYSTPVKGTAPPTPYLQNPTSCEGPLTATVDAVYYNHETVHGQAGWVGTTGCDLLAFNPSLIAKPTTNEADAPTGIDIIARVPQTQSPTVPSASELRSLSITLPEGVSVNPSAADGKSACTDGESAIGTLGAATCPQSSKVGTLSIDSSALPAPIHGALYLGEPRPGDRYRLIIAADGFETHVKIEGSVHLDPASGRIVTRFDNLPQSPLQEFDMHIFGAERGLLATPERCGVYTVDSEFVPWAAELGAVFSTDSFTIDTGPAGAPCPASTRPLAPSLVAGSTDNTAGVHTPLAVKVDRRDGHQNIDGLNLVTPPGFLATLKGVPYCSEQALAELRTPGRSGATEQAGPACPTGSQVGTAMTTEGAGSRPLNTPGRVYLAGPYKGAPVSLVVVVPAVSGPYDLGNVVVRAATYVNPTNAQITTISDPLPQIIDGVPLRLRSILVDLNRPNFAVNPTNCSPFAIDTALRGDEGALSGSTAFYQVANCSALPFAPKLAIGLRGSTKRRGHPAVRAVLTASPGDANLAETTVTMPDSLLLDNDRIRAVCTRVQFDARACPAASVYGSASAESPLLDQPLSGPVYLRSSSHELPDLVVDLHGQIDIELAATIDSTKSGGLRTRFTSLPDASVSRFVLNLDGAKTGLLVNSRSLCKGPLKAAVKLVAQSGLTVSRRSGLGTSCAKAGKRKRPRRAAHERGMIR